IARRPVAQLRLVAEREERLAAPCRLAGTRDLEHIVDRHIGPLAGSRRPRERAVVADVATQLRGRDEDLRAVGDEQSPLVADVPGRRHQLVERRPEIHLRSLCVDRTHSGHLNRCNSVTARRGGMPMNVHMNGWTRALTTMLAAGAAGFLLWLGAQWDMHTTGGYWAAMRVV